MRVRDARRPGSGAGRRSASPEILRAVLWLRSEASPPPPPNSPHQGGTRPIWRRPRMRQASCSQAAEATGNLPVKVWGARSPGAQESLSCVVSMGSDADAPGVGDSNVLSVNSAEPRRRVVSPRNRWDRWEIELRKRPLHPPSRDASGHQKWRGGGAGGDSDPTPHPNSKCRSTPVPHTLDRTRSPGGLELKPGQRVPHTFGAVAAEAVGAGEGALGNGS
jgi:hypothetical protein